MSDRRVMRAVVVDDEAPARSLMKEYWPATTMFRWWASAPTASKR